MISKSIERIRVQTIYRDAVKRHGGVEHPAVWAACARDRIVWGRERFPMPKPPGSQATDEQAHAYTTAELRAYGEAGWSNRRMRRYRRERDGTST